MNRFAERDARLLQFMARYNVWMSKFIDPLFFNGKTSGHILKRMVENGFLTLHSRKIPGSISYCTLSPAAVKAIGLPRDRAHLSSATLDQALAILYWGKTGNHIRVRVTTEEACAVVQDENAFSPNVAHVLSDAGDFGDEARLWRVYQSSTSFEKTVEYLNKQIESVSQNSTLGNLIRDRLYGFLVLVDNRAKAETLSKRMQAHSINRVAQIHVDVGPTSATIARAFKEKWELLK